MSFVARKTRFNDILSAHRVRKLVSVLQVQSSHSSARDYIGTREIVGHGFSGRYAYFDALDMPYPAIRFREETRQITKLREKEKGDWKALSLEEKKQCLY